MSEMIWGGVISPFTSFYFGCHSSCRLDKDAYKHMAGLKSVTEDDRILHIVMHHLISQFAHCHPLIDGFNPSQTFSSVEVIDERTGFFAQCCQNCGKQLVAQSILKATKSGDKGFNTLRQLGILFEGFNGFEVKSRGEKSCVCRA